MVEERLKWFQMYCLGTSALVFEQGSFMWSAEDRSPEERQLGGMNFGAPKTAQTQGSYILVRRLPDRGDSRNYMVSKLLMLMWSLFKPRIGYCRA